MAGLRIMETGDGSHTILNTDLTETYHSVHGAVRESVHVFIDHGLKIAELRCRDKPVRILEIGFGTGLNVVLTFVEAAKRKLNVSFESWEKHPLPSEILEQLNYGTVLGNPDAFRAVHRAEWDRRVNLSPGVELFKRRRDILSDTLEGSFDLIYYDAFAPSKQPELWTTEVLGKVTAALVPGGIWVTYCARGQVKRDLAALGLTVETLPGPPGKKEMIRATKR